MQAKMWRKLTETDDLISLEKQSSFNYRIRIEARYSKSVWQIFKTYFNDREVSFVEEYSTETKPEAMSVIRALQKERDLSPGEIKQIKKILGKRLTLKIERAFKEYEVEKWNFSINEDKMVNFATVRYSEKIQIDIIMHEKYRYLERKILEEIVNVLGLREFGMEIDKFVYFFNKRTFYRSRPKRRGVVISKIEMDFDDMEGSE
jgi:hypothetical protein